MKTDLKGPPNKRRTSRDHIIQIGFSKSYFFAISIETSMDFPVKMFNQQVKACGFSKKLNKKWLEHDQSLVLVY